MKYWSVLGIEPTADESIIKKAYARRLQVHHPEEDPEGYQLLREAYDWAKKRARTLQAEEIHRDGINERMWNDRTHDIDNTHNIEARNIEDTHDIEDKYNIDDTNDIEDTYIINDVNDIGDTYNIDDTYDIGDTFDLYDRDDTYEETAVKQYAWQAGHFEPFQPESPPDQVFFEEMKKLYDDFPRRIDPESWKALMTSDFMWNMEYRNERLGRLLQFLEDHRHLPRTVWEVLDQAFRLLEQKEYLLEAYDEEEVAFIIGQIEGKAELGYACFEGKRKDFDIERYLTLRHKVQTLLMNDDPKAAMEVIGEASSIFQGDPDLLLLQARCHIELGENSQAMSCLQQVLELKSEAYEARLLIAQILYEEQRFDEAERECEYLQQQGFLSQELPSDTGGSSESHEIENIKRGVAGGVLFIISKLLQFFLFPEHAGWYDYLGLIVPLALTIGIYRKSLVSAVLMLAYFVAFTLYQYAFIKLEDGPLYITLISAILIVYLWDGVKGTFTYHKYKKRRQLRFLLFGR